MKGDSQTSAGPGRLNYSFNLIMIMLQQLAPGHSGELAWDLSHCAFQFGLCQRQTQVRFEQRGFGREWASGKALTLIAA
jgi:hypothetical protein